MAHEVETKILEVDKAEISYKLDKLGAKKILETRLFVWWFRPQGTKEEHINWFLRIRIYSDGKAEVTWKGQSKTLGVSRKHEEINFAVSDVGQTKELFKTLGLAEVAYQEKDRTTWGLKTLAV